MKHVLRHASPSGWHLGSQRGRDPLRDGLQHSRPRAVRFDHHADTVHEPEGVRHFLQRLDIHDHAAPLGKPLERLSVGKAHHRHAPDASPGEHDHLVADPLRKTLGEGGIEHDLVGRLARPARRECEQTGLHERGGIDSDSHLADTLLAHPQERGPKKQRHHGPHAGDVG